MAINRLDHLSVRTEDVEATRKFYVDALGLSVGPRPDFPFPGIWLYNEGRAVVHIVGIDKDNPEGLMEYLGGAVSIDTTSSGAFDHVAFLCSDLDGMRQHFQEARLEFRERKVPNMALDQIFLTDPNGITVELNFPRAA